MFALDQFSDVAGAGDRAAAAEGLELGVFDHAVFRIDLELQLHHIAAFRRTNDSRADVLLAPGEAADVARISVVIDDFFRVSHDNSPQSALDRYSAFHWTDLRSIPSFA